MSTLSLAQPGSPDMRRIANPLHTVLLLALQAAVAIRSIMQASQRLTATNSSHVGMYVRTIIVEWLLLAFVLAGVWFAGSPLVTVLGQRWRSALDVFRDLGIGVVFIMVQQIVLSVVSANLLHGGARQATVQALLPHGPIEMGLWIVLSLSAGICEEAIFRGYLQRQFMALTKSVPAGILISAVFFGMAHGYQGFWGAVVIAIDGATLGGLAYWCRSVRPGMAGHAFKDALAPLVMAVKH